MKKRADGRYQQQIYLGLDENKKRIVKTVYGKTQKECIAKANEMRILCQKGTVMSPTATLREWVDMFLSVYKGTVSNPAYGKEKHRLYYLCDNLPVEKICDIKPMHIQAIINEFTISKETIKQYRSIWSRLFEFIIENGGAITNPVKTTKLPKTAPREPRKAISKEYRQVILDMPACDEKTILMMLLFTGMRRGELSALTSRDIKDGIITVNKNYQYVDKIIKEPKSKNGVRTIPLLPILEDYLNTVNYKELLDSGKLRNQQLMYRALRCALTSVDSKYGNGVNLQEINYGTGSKIKLSTNIEPFSLHSLRHTFATMLYEAGIPLLDAASILGHDRKMTLQIYTHLSEEQKQKSFDKLKNIFKSNSSQ